MKNLPFAALSCPKERNRNPFEILQQNKKSRIADPKEQEKHAPGTPSIHGPRIANIDKTVLSILLKKPMNNSSNADILFSNKYVVKQSNSYNDIHSAQKSCDDDSENDLELNYNYSKSTPNVPLDWCLKNQLIVFSKKSFDWCSNTRYLDECYGLKQFIGLNNHSDARSPKLEFDQALFHWVYPANHRSPCHVSMMTKIISKSETNSQSLNSSEAQEYAFFKEQEEEWKMSFRSAYLMVKNGESPYVYYINSEFSVLFQFKNDSMHAILSNSSAGLRKAFKDDGIEFKECFKRSDLSGYDSLLYTDMDEETRRDIELINQKRESDSMTNINKSLEPLEFCEYFQIQGLYDFLLKWKDPRSDRRAASLPHLYSCKPFLNASVKSAKVIRSSQIKQESGDGYKLVIKGVLLPESLQKLYKLFQEENEEFKATSTVDEKTIGIEYAINTKTSKTVELKNGSYYWR